MTPALRKLTITAHVTFSVGWLGAVAAFLVLGIAGLTSHDAEVVRGAYLSMDLISRFVIIPMCFGALATGLLQALGTPWGLFRYYWILVKFGLAIFVTIALLVHQFVVVAEAAKRISGVASETLFGADLGPLKTELVRAPSLAIVLLLVATTLGVYKPWGLTRYGRRKQQERRKGQQQPDNETPVGVKIFFAVTHYVPMIVGPTPDFGVEFMDQIGGRHAQHGFDCLPDAAQEGLNILLGGLDEQFPVGIFAHVLSEEIKTFLHVGDDRLRGRKFQTSFLQKLLDEGLDFSFQ